MERYELGVALSSIYDFTWDIFCDWYIELSKPSLINKDGENLVTAFVYRKEYACFCAYRHFKDASSLHALYNRGNLHQSLPRLKGDSKRHNGVTVPGL